MSEPTPDQPLRLSDALRLERFQNACNRLWPFIRYFGVCGADPGAISAVVEIGQLLGKDSAPISADAIQKARLETVNLVAEAVRQSPEILGAAGRGLTAKLADLVKNMRVG